MNYHPADSSLGFFIFPGIRIRISCECRGTGVARPCADLQGIKRGLMLSENTKMEVTNAIV